MTDEYIRRDFALGGTELYKYGEMEIEAVSAEHIQRLPAADVAEVVRCKDCKHRTKYGNCGHPRQKRCFAIGVSIRFLQLRGGRMSGLRRDDGGHK